MANSAWESSPTLSFTAALAVHTYNTSPGSMPIPDIRPDLSSCFVLYDLTLTVAVFVYTV